MSQRTRNSFVRAKMLVRSFNSRSLQLPKKSKRILISSRSTKRVFQPTSRAFKKRFKNKRGRRLNCSRPTLTSVISKKKGISNN